jgi:DNA-binding beta-propeller fold protein YncE
MRRSLLLFGVVGGVVLATSSASSNPSTEPSADMPVLRGRGTAVASQIALADFRGGTVAMVADEDDSSVHVFDTKPAKEIGVAKVPGTPSQLMVTKGGRVLVALKDKGQVAILEPKGGDARSLVQHASIDTGGEPVALAMTPDERTLIVASGWTHEVSAYSMEDRSQKWKVSVAREPRSIAVATDGSRAFVTHAVGGKLSVIDVSAGTASSVGTSAALGAPVNSVGFTPTPGGRSRVGTQGFAIAAVDGKVYVPTIMADPQAPETYYGAGLETLAVLRLDETTASIAQGSMQYPQPVSFGQQERCILPRAAAVSKDGKRLFVGCAGDADLQVLDATAAAPRSKPLTTKHVDDAPAAIAIDESSQALVSWSQMGRTLTVASIADKPVPSTIASASGTGLPAAVARGRRLFNAVDGRVANDGRACASCHTDGRDDGLVWNTPEGNRQTPMLAGRLSDTAPYGWTRDAKTFHDYVNGTVSRLRGKGFTKEELDDLQAYTMSLKAPPKAKPSEDPLVKRGAELFASGEAACASCHTGATTTDGKKHFIDTAKKEAFATPSLRFVGETGPYFHDGRYSSLRALLVSDDPNMGKAKDLPVADLDALEAYLKTL